MSTGTVFEVRPQKDGYRVYSMTEWGERGVSKRAGGLACFATFPNPESAMAWVNEQFRAPFTSWHRRFDGVMFTGEKPFFDQFLVETPPPATGKIRLLVYEAIMPIPGTRYDASLRAVNSLGSWTYLPARRRPHYRCSAGFLHSHWWRLDGRDGTAAVLRCREHEVVEVPATNVFPYPFLSS